MQKTSNPCDTVLVVVEKEEEEKKKSLWLNYALSYEGDLKKLYTLATLRK